MLTPEYLQAAPDTLVRLWADAEESILADLARRLAACDLACSSALYQAMKLQEMGLAYADILTRLSALTGKTDAALKTLFEDAMRETIASDAKVYRAADVYKPSDAGREAMQSTLNAGLRQTQSTVRNLTRTTADTTAHGYVDALDLAWTQISSGAIDYNTAVKNAVTALADRGLEVVTYDSGRRDKVEVAVRRAVVTGVNQTALKVQIQLADDLGCDLVETTAHAGARPTHAVRQGKIFSRSGQSKKYLDFTASTGYGTGAGLGGWNCRHSFYPYIDGSPRAYTDAELAAYDAKTIRYGGKDYTEYEASQIQRGLERNIRKLKREKAALGAVGADTKEVDAALREAKAREKAFCKETGLKWQPERENIGSKTVAKSAKADIIETGGDRVTIGSIDSSVERKHTGKGNPNAIIHYDVGLTNRQSALSRQLTEKDSRITVPRGEVGLSDLSALTASTGAEYEMFTKGGERLIVRGDSTSVSIDESIAREMAQAGYRWSGHTHPGAEQTDLLPSEGDKAILRAFGQTRSVIYNSKGNFNIFEEEEGL